MLTPRKWRYITAITIITLMIFCIPAISRSILIGPLADSMRGNGCYYSAKGGGGPVFFSDHIEGWMNIDNKDIQLRYVDKKRKLFTSGNIIVKLKYLPVGNQGFEQEIVVVSITVKKGNAIQTIQAHGICGI